MDELPRAVGTTFWVRIGGFVVVLAMALALAPSLRGAAAATASARAATVTLSPRQMAGQRVIYSYTGLKPPASLLSLIRHGEAAGVIFFGDNIEATRRSARSSRRWSAPTPAPRTRSGRRCC